MIGRIQVQYDTQMIVSYLLIADIEILWAWKVGKYRLLFGMKNIDFDKFIIFSVVGIFLDKTEQNHLLTKLISFGNVILMQKWVAKDIRLIFLQPKFPPQHHQPLQKKSPTAPPSPSIWGISVFLRCHLVWQIHKFCLIDTCILISPLIFHISVLFLLQVTI